MITVEKPGHYPAYFDRLKREKDWDIHGRPPANHQPDPASGADRCGGKET
jgi:hypothetical protein